MWAVLAVVGVAVILGLAGVVWLSCRPFMLTEDEQRARDLSAKIGERAAEEWLRSRRL